MDVFSEPDPDPDRRRRLGAWYTPEALVEVLVSEALERWPLGDSPVTVLDPACGDGRFLAVLAERLGSRCRLTGVDVDAEALAAARIRLGQGAELLPGDALAHDWSGRHFDLVIGNPPFLSQLSALTSRGGTSVHGGGVYADAAVEFLALAHRLARPDGGRVALVLPLSVLASRDAGLVRSEVARDSAIVSCWWSARSVFPEAQVHTCALVIERGRPLGAVRRLRDLPPTPVSALVAESAISPDTDGWGWLVADGLGIPDADTAAWSVAGTLGDRCAVRGDFRQQFYGLVGAVHDDVDGSRTGNGPPLVTSGLIDPGRCAWGQRAVRFAGQRYGAPRVDVAHLSPPMQAWAGQRLVPKVLVASQTRVIEAVADPGGRWLPSVPVVSAIPLDGSPSTVWEIAAVLTSPAASAWLAQRSAGTGRSSSAVRVSAPRLSNLPWPAGDLRSAVAALQAGEVERCGALMEEAYGYRSGGDRMAWWLSALPGRRG